MALRTVAEAGMAMALGRGIDEFLTSGMTGGRVVLQARRMGVVLKYRSIITGSVLTTCPFR